MSYFEKNTSTVESSHVDRFPLLPTTMEQGVYVSTAIVTLLAAYHVFRFVHFYVRARSQFPGPPVKNFWVGNLDQTMANNVHEKVCRPR